MGHYYGIDGSPQYEIIGKNGKKRGTNITDARRLGLVPSVTEIMGVQAKPALIMWIQNQLIEACIDTPFYSGLWTKEEYKKYLIGQSKRVGEAAAKRGNEIHDSMESYIKTNLTDDNVEYTHDAIQLLGNQFDGYTWIAEKSFAHPDGFGGRVDLHGYDTKGNYVVIDFKTKDKTNEKDMVQYDDHRIQLAAYQVGLGLPNNTRRFNLFIGVHKDRPGLCKLVECKKFDKSIQMFYALLNWWKIKNDYTSGGVK